MFGVNPEKAACVLFFFVFFPPFVKWFDIRTERLLNGFSQPKHASRISLCVLKYFSIGV